MNRRRFLQFTIALAACAPIARLPSLLPAPIPPEMAPLGWVPTQAQVDEWLEYYKICVQQGTQKFADLLMTVHVPEAQAVVIDDPLEWSHLFASAERAFNALAADRNRVGLSQGAGYAAGRDGLARCNPAYSAASNEAFGWYNMWAVGDADRRGVKLPRSPGVTYPEGKRPRYLDQYT